ncbi:MAG: ATP-binding protein [Sandaracinaceae bacterium]
MAPSEFDSAHLAVLEHIEQPTWVFDLEQERTFWSNRRALELFSAASLACLNARQARAVLTDGMRRRFESYKDRFEQGETVEERWTFYPEGASPVEARCRCSALTIREGEARRAGMLVEAHPVQSGPVAQDLRLLEALHHATDCISLYRLDGPALTRNASAVESLGPLEGVDFRGSFANPADAMRALQEARSLGVYRAELPVPTRHGPRWYDTEVRLVRDPVDGDAALLVIQHDVTDQRQNRGRLVAAREQAEAASKAKTSFLAVMSHELRTPMMGVLTAAELLRQSPLDQSQQEALEMVFAAGRQMVGLIDDVLDLSRIEAGGVHVEWASTELRALLIETLRPFHGQAKSRGLTLSLEVDDDVPPRVRSDPRRLSQILSNLVANALKFTERGGVVVRLRLRQRDDAEELTLVVSDTGIGMPPEAASRVFELFEQVDPSAARSREGAGLGLAIVRRLAQALGGEVGVRSQPDWGTTFSVWLPCERVTEASPPRRDTPVIELPGLRVLVADDNALNRRALARVLRRWGCDVSEAADGREALDIARVAHPNLILMDVWMPGMDGPSAARVLRGGPLAETPIVALSADVFFDNAEALFDEVLVKPVEWHRLQSALLAQVKAETVEARRAEA